MKRLKNNKNINNKNNNRKLLCLYHVLANVDIIKQQTLLFQFNYKQNKKFENVQTKTFEYKKIKNLSVYII